MKIYLHIYLFISIIILISVDAEAGAIKMVTSLKTAIAGEQIDVKVSIKNKGDEAAYNVQVAIEIRGMEKVRHIKDKLRAHETCEAAFSFPLNGEKGWYPIIVNTTYSDYNQNPYHTITVTKYALKGKTSEISAHFVKPCGTAASTQICLKNSKIKNIAVIITDNSQGTVQNITSPLKHGAGWEQKPVTLKLIYPENIDIEPNRFHITLGRMEEQEVFFRIKNRSFNPGSSTPVYAVAEYDEKGAHYLTITSILISVEKGENLFARWNKALVTAGVLLALICIAIYAIKIPKLKTQNSKLKIIIPDILINLAVILFLLSYFKPEYLFSSVITTGGDTGSHYYTAQFMRDVLLPQGKIAGWMMGNYAGFPIFQFYFPFPFLLMAVLSYLIPLQISFKLVTVLGIFILPLCSYAALRLMDQRFPVPAVGAVFSMLFLFMEANSMWGGNITSTLAGEFAYGIGMSLTILFAGTLYRGIRSGKYIFLNAILIFLIGFSHGYTLLFAVLMSSFFLFDYRDFLKNVIYLLKVHTLGFLLLGFWLIPLMGNIHYTTAYADRWFIKSILEIFPPILWPGIIIAVAGLFIVAIRIIADFFHIHRGVLLHYPLSRDSNTDAGSAPILFFGYGLIMSWFFYIIAPEIGVIDIRFLPFLQIFFMLAGALGVGILIKPLKVKCLKVKCLKVKCLKVKWMIPVIAILFVIPYVNHFEKKIESWIPWNYTGFEAKRLWPAFSRVNRFLKGSASDPRVVYEHSPLHNGAGTTRAFESLPLFSGRSTLEGLYMQSSISSPFVFYIQSEISQKSSRPFPQYKYSNVNLANGIEHLKLFNVKDFIVVSPEIKEKIKEFPQFKPAKTIPPYSIYELTTNENRYVTPLKYEPILCKTQNWKKTFFRWFKNYGKYEGVHLVFDPQNSTDTSGFKSAIDSYSFKSLPRIPINEPCDVSEEIRQEEIIIRTSAPGVPLLIKISYHPNWKVEGADRVYLASPSFMLIFPNSEKVRLYFGKTFWNYFGNAFTVLGVIIIICGFIPFTKGKPFCFSKYLNIIERNQKRIVITLAVISIVGAVVLIISAGQHPKELKNKGIICKDRGKLEEARAIFKRIVDNYPGYPRVDEAAYYYAICYYKDKNWKKTTKAFRSLVEKYPDSVWVPEAWFHIGKSHARLGNMKQAEKVFRLIIEKHPSTEWARYAKKRIRDL